MLYFFHGLESGPHGQKYQLLKAEYAQLRSPDFQGMDLETRLLHAEANTRGTQNLVVIGSSFGGLVAARLYSAYPERFKGLVLLAPAVHTEEGDRIARMPDAQYVRVIQGQADDVVPHERVAAFCRRFDLPLMTVEDGHRLAESASQDAIVQAVREVLAAS
ncbi:MAG: alpha/beta fold hydrolase [Idiomarina sp.]|nr:alpha/beta fold hydrolase [Idiomarina sp.]